MTFQVPPKYERFNSQQTKQLAVVVKIAGIGDVLTSRKIFTRVLFGDPVTYGMPGLVYGGLRTYINPDGTTFRDYLALDQSGMTISQRIEPEQGKASISNLALGFIDKDGFMTQLISPGVMVPEILGREVEVFLGYAEISYPQDYLRIYRGYIAGVESGNGLVTLQLSDPNLKRRQQVFSFGKFKSTAAIDATSVTAPTMAAILPTGGMPTVILTPQGDFSPQCKIYLKIDAELIKIDFTPVRGQRGTLGAPHAIGTDVSVAVAIEDTAIDLALRIMLSGWAGPFITNIPVLSIGPSTYGDDANPLYSRTDFIILPPKVDARRDYGLVEGDFFSITGSDSAPNNDGTLWPIIRFDSFEGQDNRVIYIGVSTGLYKDRTSATLKVAFRSQYDTLPVLCGLKLSPRDVDIDGHLYVKRTFGSIGTQMMRFFIDSEESSGKNFIENEIYKPIGCYSLTRRGQLSVGITRPPLADQKLVILDQDNILNPKELKPSRSVSNRGFYNQVGFKFDLSDAGEYSSIYKIIDSDSITDIGITKELAMESRGLKSIDAPLANLEKIGKLILTRYKRGAVTLSPKVNWEAGSLIEAGDVIAVRDNGKLQISNFSTGKRDIGVQLFEVIDRSLDIKSGNVSLKLSAGIGGDANDRYATISPSSQVSVGSTASEIIIIDSYGAIYPGDEKRKWKDYTGVKITVHSDDWSVVGETTLLSFRETNDYAMQVSPALSFTPLAGYVVELSPYSASVDPSDQQAPKIIHAFLDGSIPVASGTSATAFTVSTAYIGRFKVGSPLLIHNEDWTRNSGEINILAINTATGQITLKTAAPFTPAATDKVEYCSFPDGGGPYRII